MGCDRYLDEDEQGNPAFQSTHPHGVRLVIPEQDYKDYEFQSTHPHGVRQTCNVDFMDVIRVSIHAPTWGATRLFRCVSV